ncbi:hypothetical protein KY345_06115, partial [Candidatus Woesearchaeota archaeon]|nr:hypothetical protein [Candidatus Woesearchaeota archaeon]
MKTSKNKQSFFRRNKKARLWESNVITAIITVVVIIIIVFIFREQIIGAARNLFKLGEVKIEDEMAVTEAEYKVTQLKTISNSVDSLVCAINSISAGVYPHESCGESYEISRRILPERAVNEVNYAKIIGDEMLDCYKGYKNLKDIDFLPCTLIKTINPLAIKEKEINNYLETLEKEDKDADELAGWGWFGKEYTIKLTENTIAEEAIMCGHDK